MAVRSGLADDRNAPERLGLRGAWVIRPLMAQSDVGMPRPDHPTKHSEIRHAKPITATRWIRAMSGGTQSQMCEADDGHTYVVKSCWNPQGRRTLVNEWIANELYRHCGLSVAVGIPIRIAGTVLADLCKLPSPRYWNLDPSFTLHFGSQLPVNPEQEAIYDFVPAQLLRSVMNLQHFLGALVLDCWLANVDVRQSVFFRGTPKRWVENSMVHSSKKGLIALMIDNGQCFNGGQWSFKTAQPVTPYRAGGVYAGVSGLQSFSPWIERIAAISTNLLDALRTNVPAEWMFQDENALDCLLEDLFRRKSLVPRLLSEVHLRTPSAFPNWKAARS